MSPKLMITALLMLCAASSFAASLPMVDQVDPQPLLAQIDRLAEALQSIGSPLTSQQQAGINAVRNETDPRKVTAGIQTIFDPMCLLGVTINSQSYLQTVQGPANPALMQKGWRPFLIKVNNPISSTAVLNATSPNSLPMEIKSSNSPNPPQSLTQADADNRWMDIAMFNHQPLNAGLSGLQLEYRLVELYARDAGSISGALALNIGGAPDPQLRNQVTMAFTRQSAVSVALQVLDDDLTPTTGQFTITDSFGRICPAQTRRFAPDFFFQPQVYRANGEAVLLAPGAYSVTYTRGPEYQAFQRTITVPANSSTSNETFQLKRWINLAKQGWYSGDHHIHAAGCSHYECPTQGVSPSDMFRQVLGEDLAIGCVLSWGPCWYYQKQFFNGQISNLSTSSNLLRYDVEVSGFPSSPSGHICLLRMPEDDYPGTTAIEQWPSWDLPILQWAKQQGGTTGFPHSGWGLAVGATTLPTYIMPPFDGIGANEYIVDVTHNVVDFISACDTPITWEMSIWYHTLNCGFTTRIAGETDFPCIYDDRAGTGRTYVKLNGGSLSFDDWIAGLRDGRSYVGDGRSHLYNFQANTVPVGMPGANGRTSVLAITKGNPVHVSLKAAAMLPAVQDAAGSYIANTPIDQKPYWHLERARVPGTRQVPVELIVNGFPAQKKLIAADGSINDVTFDYTPTMSSWIAVRVWGSSHTNPIFVELDNKPIRASRKSANWCRQAVDVCWNAKKAGIRSSEQPAAQSAYDAARNAYNNIIAASFDDTAQSPYLGAPIAIPGTINVAQYDNGGESIAYHDIDQSNNASASYRFGEGVDSTGTGVGWVYAGEWIEYTLNVGATGNYTISAPMSNPGTGGTFHVSFGGVNKTGTLNVPATGSWGTQQNVTKTVALNAGTQVMQIFFDSNGSTGSVCGLGDITVSGGTGGNQPPSVSLTAPSHNANFSAPANITLGANASDSDGTISKVEFFQGSTLIGADATSPYSFAWNNVAAGTYSLTAKATDNGGAQATSAAVGITVGPAANNQTPYNGAPFAIPGTINVSRYDFGGEGTAYHDNDAANNMSSTYRPGEGVDTNGSTGIGWGQAPEWIEYTINVAQAGAYQLSIPVCYPGTGASIHVSFNGVNATGAWSMPNTGSWDVLQTISKTVTLSPGTQIMQIAFDVNGTNGYGPGIRDITISGGSANQPPSVNMTAPTNNASFTAPANITLTANASDSDGTVSKVDFYQGATLLGTATGSPYSFAWNDVSAGSYSLTAKATDNSGAQSTSAAVNITVNSAQNSQTPFSGAPMAVPGTIETAKFDNGGEGTAFHDTDGTNQMSNIWRPGLGVDSNGNGVGWIYAGEWLEYTVNVGAGGSYTLSIPMSQTSAGGAMHVSFNGVNATGSLSIPNTGSWDAYQNVTSSVSLSAGQQVMLVMFDAAGANGFGPGLRNMVISGGGSPSRSPYTGTPIALPGTILTAQYDNGGEGVAYHDVDSANLASSTYRPGQGVDSNGSGVGWILGGEWVEYTVSPSAAGNFVFSIPVCYPGTGATMHLNVNGVNVTGTLAIPNTGSWSTFQNVTTGAINLSAGTQILRAAFDANGSNGYGPGLGDIQVTSNSNVPASTPYSGTPMSVPGTVTASKYDNGGEGIAYHDIEAANFMSGTFRPGQGVDANAGQGIGWIVAGEWANYTLTVANAGNYILSFPVSSPAAGGTMHIEFGGVNKTGTISVPNTGGWDVNQTVTASASLSAGTQIMRVRFDSNNAAGGYVCGLGDSIVFTPTSSG